MAPKSWSSCARLLPSAPYLPTAKEIIAHNTAAAAVLAYAVEYEPPASTPDTFTVLGLRMVMVLPRLNRFDMKKACLNLELSKQITEQVDKIMEAVLVRGYAISFILSNSWFLVVERRHQGRSFRLKSPHGHGGLFPQRQELSWTDAASPGNSSPNSFASYCAHLPAAGQYCQEDVQRAISSAARGPSDAP